MIKFLYKIFHYEPSSNHEENVKRTLHIIWALVSTVPVSVAYLLYIIIRERNIYFDLTFYFIELAIVGISYYLLVVRMSKVFLEAEIGMDYYNFGKFNAVGKTLAVLVGFGVVIGVGRMMSLVLDSF